MAAHSRIRAWKISWREEPRVLQSMWLQRVGHDGAHMVCKYFFCQNSNFFLKLLIGPNVFSHVKAWHTLGFIEKILILILVSNADLFQRADCVLTFSLLTQSYSLVLIPILKLFKETAIKPLLERLTQPDTFTIFGALSWMGE